MKVRSGGREQIFNNVSQIHAYGGSGNDQILIKQGVLVPVVLDGGAGDDSLTYLGSGGATLTGGDGDDFLDVGPQATGTIVLDGGAGDDFLVDEINAHDEPGRRHAHRRHGPGLDLRRHRQRHDLRRRPDDGGHASTGDDSDNIDGGGGIDTVYGGGGDDVIKVTMPATAMPTIRGGAGSDFLVITASTGNDNLTIESGRLAHGVGATDGGQRQDHRHRLRGGRRRPRGRRRPGLDLPARRHRRDARHDQCGPDRHARPASSS